MNAIETRGLSKLYGPDLGLRPLSLTVPPGEIFGFLGPNGAGKTTAIRTLLGFLRPSGGSGRIFGLDVWAQRESVHARVGYLPGEVKLSPGWTALTLLRRSAALRGSGVPAEAREIAARLDLDLTRRVGTLSKGNRQKVGLVLALMHRPDLLILDEPTDGLDPLAQGTVLELLREARAGGRTVFLSSHMLPEVEQVADRVGLIRGGELVRLGRLDALRASLPQQLRVEFARPPRLDLRTLPALSDVTIGGLHLRGRWRGAPGELLRALAAEEVAALSLTPPTLEEAFLDEYRQEAAHVD